MTTGQVLNRTIFTGDNLPVLRGINTASVDLVYLDPPFNSKKQWSAPIGSKAAGAAFKDTWTLSDVDEVWHDQLRAVNPRLHDVILAARAAGGDSTMSYLLMMAPRLLELKRVLKDTGSIYLHCDPTESHAIKLMLDTVFGRQNFRNEIIWHYTNRLARNAGRFGTLHDVVLFYTVGDDYTYNPVYDENWEPSATQARRLAKGWEVRKDDLLVYDAAKLEEAKAAAPGYRVVMAKASQPPVGDTWLLPILNPMARERVGYPTQKPVALLERIISASSNPGDVVLDPFAGCATAAVAAERLGRQWIGIDISPKAAELVELRLVEQLGLAASLTVHRTDLPRRTDLGPLQKPATWKKELYGEQEGHCRGCEEHFQARHLEIDHIVPKAAGGTDHRDNLQLMCGSCNRRKGAGSMSKFTARLIRERTGGY